MNVRYTHYRLIADSTFADELKRGSPTREMVHEYHRGHGFPYARYGGDSNEIAYMKVKPSARGGMTRCQILDERKTVLAEGWAICSMSDNFKYRVGRELSFNRAIQNILDKHIKKSVDEKRDRINRLQASAYEGASPSVARAFRLPGKVGYVVILAPKNPESSS